MSLQDELRTINNSDSLHKIIIDFIERFTPSRLDKTPIVEVFTSDMCYYFAVILNERFNGSIVYDCVLGHFYFYCWETKKFYDVNGGHEFEYDKNRYKTLNELFEEDYSHYKRIVEDVILKIK